MKKNTWLTPRMSLLFGVACLFASTTFTMIHVTRNGESCEVVSLRDVASGKSGVTHVAQEATTEEPDRETDLFSPGWNNPAQENEDSVFHGDGFLFGAQDRQEVRDRLLCSSCVQDYRQKTWPYGPRWSEREQRQWQKETLGSLLEDRFETSHDLPNHFLRRLYRLGPRGCAFFREHSGQLLDAFNSILSNKIRLDFHCDCGSLCYDRPCAKSVFDTIVDSTLCSDTFFYRMSARLTPHGVKPEDFGDAIMNARAAVRDREEALPYHSQRQFRDWPGQDIEQCMAAIRHQFKERHGTSLLVELRKIIMDDLLRRHCQMTDRQLAAFKRRHCFVSEECQDVVERYFLDKFFRRYRMAGFDASFSERVYELVWNCDLASLNFMRLPEYINHWGCKNFQTFHAAVTEVISDPSLQEEEQPEPSPQPDSSRENVPQGLFERVVRRQMREEGGADDEDFYLRHYFSGASRATRFREQHPDHARALSESVKFFYYTKFDYFYRRSGSDESLAKEVFGAVLREKFGQEFTTRCKFILKSFPFDYAKLGRVVAEFRVASSQSQPDISSPAAASAAGLDRSRRGGARGRGRRRGRGRAGVASRASSERSPLTDDERNFVRRVLKFSQSGEVVDGRMDPQFCARFLEAKKRRAEGESFLEGREPLSEIESMRLARDTLDCKVSEAGVSREDFLLSSYFADDLQARRFREQHPDHAQALAVGLQFFYVKSFKEFCRGVCADQSLAEDVFAMAITMREEDFARSCRTHLRVSGFSFSYEELCRVAAPFRATSDQSQPDNSSPAAEEELEVFRGPRQVSVPSLEDDSSDESEQERPRRRRRRIFREGAPVPRRALEPCTDYSIVQEEEPSDEQLRQVLGELESAYREDTQAPSAAGSSSQTERLSKSQRRRRAQREKKQRRRERRARGRRLGDTTVVQPVPHRSDEQETDEPLRQEEQQAAVRPTSNVDASVLEQPERSSDGREGVTEDTGTEIVAGVSRVALGSMGSLVGLNLGGNAINPRLLGMLGENWPAGQEERRVSGRELADKIRERIMEDRNPRKVITRLRRAVSDSDESRREAMRSFCLQCLKKRKQADRDRCEEVFTPLIETRMQERELDYKIYCLRSYFSDGRLAGRFVEQSPECAEALGRAINSFRLSCFTREYRTARYDESQSEQILGRVLAQPLGQPFESHCKKFLSAHEGLPNYEQLSQAVQACRVSSGQGGGQSGRGSSRNARRKRRRRARERERQESEAATVAEQVVSTEPDAASSSAHQVAVEDESLNVPDEADVPFSFENEQELIQRDSGLHDLFDRLLRERDWGELGDYESYCLAHFFPDSDQAQAFAKQYPERADMLKAVVRHYHESAFVCCRLQEDFQEIPDQDVLGEMITEEMPDFPGGCRCFLAVNDHFNFSYGELCDSVRAHGGLLDLRDEQDNFPVVSAETIWAVIDNRVAEVLGVDGLGDLGLRVDGEDDFVKNFLPFVFDEEHRCSANYQYFQVNHPQEYEAFKNCVRGYVTGYLLGHQDRLTSQLRVIDGVQHLLRKNCPGFYPCDVLEDENENASCPFLLLNKGVDPDNFLQVIDGIDAERRAEEDEG